MCCGCEAHADEACGEIFEAGEACDYAKNKRWMNWSRVLQHFVQDAVDEDLKGWRPADGLFAVLLDLPEMVRGQGIGAVMPR